MKRFTLIGHHLTHSISPLIHKTLFSLSGFDGDYDITEIDPEFLEEGFRKTAKENEGFNITIPHKINVIPFFADLSDEAKKLGSVNTAVRGEDGRLYGHNTDYYGFTEALKRSGILGKVSSNALLLGSGGVSKTFGHALADMSFDITIAARNREAAESLANELSQGSSKKIRCIALDDERALLSIPSPFIVNGTPVGMYPKTGFSPISGKVTEGASGIFDAIYNPQDTKLIEDGKVFGVPTLCGLSMLVFQAIRAQELWNRLTFGDGDVEKVMQLCIKHLDSVKSRN